MSPLEGEAGRALHHRPLVHPQDPQHHRSSEIDPDPHLVQALDWSRRACSRGANTGSEPFHGRPILRLQRRQRDRAASAVTVRSGRPGEPGTSRGGCPPGWDSRRKCRRPGRRGRTLRSPRIVAGLAAVALSAGVIALTPAPAAAHAFLVSSSPRPGERLPSGPPSIQLRFSEPVAGGERGHDRDRRGRAHRCRPGPPPGGRSRRGRFRFRGLRWP